MADRPILFSAPMILALLAGRKTQTRRILKPQPQGDVIQHGWSREAGSYWMDQSFTSHKLPIWAGDRLWCREAWRTLQKWDCLKPSHLADDASKITFDADPERRNPLWAFGKLRPSIFMPRWASRITLKVTDVRVERLLDISEEDAIAEGIEEVWGIIGASGAGGVHHEINGFRYYFDGGDSEGYETAEKAYFALWDSINGDGASALNPWVSVYEFEIVLANIDEANKP